MYHFSHNLPEYCIAFHALARAGLTVTTCNPVYTVEETQHQLKDSNAKAVITVEDYLDKVKQITAGLNNCKNIWVMGDFTGSGLKKSPVSARFFRKDIRIF